MATPEHIETRFLVFRFLGEQAPTGQAILQSLVDQLQRLGYVVDHFPFVSESDWGFGVSGKGVDCSVILSPLTSPIGSWFVCLEDSHDLNLPVLDNPRTRAALHPLLEAAICLVPGVADLNWRYYARSLSSSCQI